MRDLIITVIIIIITLEDMIRDHNLENIEINISIAKIFRRVHHLIGIVIVMIQITVIVMIHIIVNPKSEIDLLLLLIDMVVHLQNIRVEDMTLKVLVPKVEAEVLVVERTPTTKIALENDGQGLIYIYISLDLIKHTEFLIFFCRELFLF